ncbi:DNA topoisomerase 2 [Hordeum vulgare]|nr:DNA topoisomerase 2 [Hordeum vulgare]
MGRGGACSNAAASDRALPHVRATGPRVAAPSYIDLTDNEDDNGGPCSSFDSCASVFTVVLDRSCSRRVYIPCSVRSHLARYIEECRALAIRRGDTDVDLALHNSEALEDLSETRRELVDSCFYSRGVTLNYHQMITSMNVNDQHMDWSSTLEIGLDSEDDDIYVSIPCSYFIGLGGRMVFKKEGFSNFLRASSIEVNNLVLITFKERDQELAVIFNLLPQ